MENLPKETLITIINDLNEKLKEKNELCKNFVDENAEIQGKEIIKLQKQLKASQSERDKYREKCREWSDRYKEQQSEFTDMIDIKNKYKSERDELIQRLEDDSSSVSSNEDKKVDNFNMNTQQRCNLINFIQKFCIWTKEPIPIDDGCGNSFTTIAPESSTKLHKNLRAWAIQQGIATKGKERGIPDKVSFVKFMTNEHNKRYPEQSFKPQEKWEYPYPYWGTHSSPRFNLRLKRTFTS
jgi:hypothetical protein